MRVVVHNFIGGNGHGWRDAVRASWATKDAARKKHKRTTDCGATCECNTCRDQNRMPLRSIRDAGPGDFVLITLRATEEQIQPVLAASRAYRGGIALEKQHGPGEREYRIRFEKDGLAKVRAAAASAGLQILRVEPY